MVGRGDAQAVVLHVIRPHRGDGVVPRSGRADLDPPGRAGSRYLTALPIRLAKTCSTAVGSPQAGGKLARRRSRPLLGDRRPRGPRRPGRRPRATSTGCHRYSTRPARDSRSRASMIAESRVTAVWMKWIDSAMSRVEQRRRASRSSTGAGLRRRAGRGGRRRRSASSLAEPLEVHQGRAEVVRDAVDEHLVLCVLLGDRPRHAVEDGVEPADLVEPGQWSGQGRPSANRRAFSLKISIRWVNPRLNTFTIATATTIERTADHDRDVLPPEDHPLPVRSLPVKVDLRRQKDSEGLVK